jgi:predicted acylesterase/phospholipase RssA
LAAEGVAVTGTQQRDMAVLADPASYRDRRLNCDLVMKGGITSGVVYPLAVSQLALTYRFKNIGGTSAGAIAAAAAAAAQHEGAGNGFAQLAALPCRLGAELESLFRPQRRCKRLFRLIFASTKPAEDLGEKLSKPVKLVAYLLSFLISIAALGVLAALSLPAVGVGIGLQHQIADHWWHGAVLLALLWFTLIAASGLRRGSWRKRAIVLLVAAASIIAIVLVSIAGGLDAWAIAAWLAICVITVLLAVVVAIALEVFKVIPANDYGLVAGSALDTDQKDGDVEPLSEWLHTLIQDLAGVDRGSPLTFGQLFDGPSGKPDEGVNLTLLTTCISQGRTYYLPWDLALPDPEDRFYFDPSELRRSMPGAVVDYLLAFDRDRKNKDWLDVALAPLVPLPPPDRIPVVMATRMSLSFPVLISTVPLRAVDWTLTSNREARRQWREWDARRVEEPNATRPEVTPNAERCYFSDGGIISNFPVHLFDVPLPRHPTFAINLRGFHPDRVEFDDDSKPEIEKIWRPRKNGSGYSEMWTRWSPSGAGAVFGFALALKNSVQNWSDNDQTRVPGYRDRVVHVSHGRKEGGLNLSMPAPRIARLGERGRLAAENLAAAFAHPQPLDGATTGWRNHKWIRLRSSLALLSAQVASISRAFDADDPCGVDRYRDLLEGGPESAPSYQATQLQRNALLAFLDGEAPTDGVGAHDCGVLGASRRLSSKIAEHATVSPEHDAPGPAPTLRVAPGHRHAPPPAARAAPSVVVPDMEPRR